MRQGVAERFESLRGLYEHFIERRFHAAQHHRNKFIVEAIPFLLRCVCPELAVELVMMFYDTHNELFHDTREQHEREVRAMIENVENTYLYELSAGEREVFALLSTQEQSAFRICRDLALLSSKSRMPMTFFLSSTELATRLQIWTMQAYRILQGFVTLGILYPLEVGERREAGKQPKASTFQWLMKLPKPKVAAARKG